MKKMGVFTGALGLLFCFGVTVYAQVHSIEQTFTVEPGGILDVNIYAGNVVVRGWDRDEVSIEGEVYGSPQMLNKMELRLEKKDNDIIIHARKINQPVIRRSRSRDNRINLTINVPFEYHARLNVIAGSIDAENIDGSVTARSSAGSIRVSDVFGSIDIDTATGSISVGLIERTGNVSLTTAVGSINIEVPRDINARFKLNSAIGRVTSRLDDFSGSGTSMDFGYNEGGVLVEARTAIGNITVSSY